MAYYYIKFQIFKLFVILYLLLSYKGNLESKFINSLYQYLPQNKNAYVMIIYVKW